MKCKIGFKLLVVNECFSFWLVKFELYYCFNGGMVDILVLGISVVRCGGLSFF